MVGTSSVAHARPDGYTLLLIEASSVLAKWLHKKVPFNVETDFTPIAMVATNYLGLFGDASLPANNLAELVRYSKAHPAKLSVGIPGIGTPHHLAALMFERSTGLELVHVTYRGSPPSVSDLVAGRIPLVWAVPINVMPFVAQGKAKLLAISSPRRLAALPHVATVAEQGLPGFDVTLWLGIAGPAGISAEIVSQLNTAMQAIAALPDLQHRLATLGYTLDYGGGDKLREQMLSDHRKYGEVILKAGIEPN